MASRTKNLIIRIVSSMVLLGSGYILPVPEANASVAVIGGEAAESCQFAAVGRVVGSDASCTATLVHPELVITAAHCLELELTSFVLGEDADAARRTIPVISCQASPLWPAESGELTHDLAYCRLGEAVNDVPVTPVLAGCERDVLEDTPLSVWGVGFGESDLTTGKQTKAWSSGLTLSGSDAAQLQDISGDATFCRGDSGAGIFAQLDPKLFQGDDSFRLVAVVASGPGTCDGDSKVSVIDAAFLSFVAQDSGVDPWACFDDVWQWQPGAQCGGFLRRPSAARGDWDNACQGIAVQKESRSCAASADTQAPTLTLLAPQDGQVFAPGDVIQIEVEAGDDVAVDEVILETPLLIDGDAKRFGPSYTWTAKGEVAGTYEFSASGRDPSGNQAMSAVVRIEIRGEPDTSGESSDSDTDTGETTSGTGTQSTSGEDSTETTSATTTTSDSTDSSGDEMGSDATSQKDSCACSSAGGNATWAWTLVLIGVLSRRRSTTVS